jgi:succinyl-CoA synthetase alpha subunit
MSILLDDKTTVLVQGITGREGQARTRLMLDYGTRVVGGVTPGKGGTQVLGLPVFDSCADAVRSLGSVDVSVLFVPAAGAKAAALDAINAGVRLVVMVPDRIPVWDAMEIAAATKAASRPDNPIRFLGPNTLGIASPGKAVVGMIGGRAESAREWFKPPLRGHRGKVGGTGVGVISRSGGMSSSTAYYLGQAGVRISSIVHVGGDSVLGIRVPEVALLFQNDPATDAIVLFGEIGGSQEEELADLISSGKVTKPVIAYIGGKAAKAGTRFSHAGAIIEGNRGTHAGKVAALRAAGAAVVDAFGELPDAVVAVLRAKGSKSLMSDAERKAVWTTAITKIEPNKVAVRGIDIASLMGKVSFGAAVYLILTGEPPDEKIGRLMDAILVSSIDHGATPPSCLAARTVASTGASLSQSVAAGISSINRHHGGAIEDCARYLASLIEKAKARASGSPSPREEAGGGRSDSTGTTPEAHARALEEVAADEVARVKSTGDRISGFGHRIHTKDPRTARLFELAQEAGLSDSPSPREGAGGGRSVAHDPANNRDNDIGISRPTPSLSPLASRPSPLTHIAAARALERAFAAIGKPLPINVDGAIGAILADLDLDPAVFNGIFMIARTPGLVAHVTEEKTREKPMRRIDPVNHAYDGPIG